MLKFHIIIIKFSIFTNKNSESDTFFPKLKNTIVKIDIKSFSVYLVAIVSRHLRQNDTTTLLCTLFEPHISIFNDLESLLKKSQPAWETISTEN